MYIIKVKSCRFILHGNFKMFGMLYTKAIGFLLLICEPACWFAGLFNTLRTNCAAQHKREFVFI